MKLISGFKDYYDYVGHQYGTGDPKNTYVRGKISGQYVCAEIDIPSPITRSNYWNGAEKEPDHYWLALNGKFYQVVKEYEKFHVLHKSTLSEEFYKKLTQSNRAFRWIHNRHKEVYDDEKFLKLFRALQLPVFAFTTHKYTGLGPTVEVKDSEGNTWLKVFTNTPVLSDLGFPKFYDAFQMYQDISYFNGNMLSENPDGSPISVMTDKEKIVAAGFDTKVSFRHRK